MSSDKLKLKYLVHGTIEVDTPDGWDKMSDKEKQYYADMEMNRKSDHELVEGLRDSSVYGQVWDETPDVCAIIDPLDEEDEYTMLSKTWYGFAYGSCKPGLLVENANRLVCSDELFRDY